MTTGKQNSETMSPGSGQARRPKRGRAKQPYELSLETLREAVLELLRLAVEYESPHAPLDPHLTASDQAVRLAVGEISGMHAVLEEVVRTVLDHRDHRRELIKQVRTAQALREVADEFRKRSRKWTEEQRNRAKSGEPRHTMSSSPRFRRELTEYVRERFSWWAVLPPEPEDLLQGIVDAAVLGSQADAGSEREGLWKRLANVAFEATTVSPDTLEKISAALAGKTQRAGRFKKPEHAVAALGDDPVGGSEILGYVVRLLVARGHPEQVEHAVMQAWIDEVFAPRPRADGASSPSSDDPTASS